MSQKDFRALIEHSLAGADVATSLERLIQPNGPDDKELMLEDWWRGILPEILQVDGGFMESLEASRKWIAELSDMSTVAEGEFNLRTIWKQRDNEEVRKVIQARYEILKLRLIRINPAYFNSARSLGRLYETLLEGEKNFEYIRNLSSFLSDFEDTKRIEEILRSEL